MREARERQHAVDLERIKMMQQRDEEAAQATAYCHSIRTDYTSEGTRRRARPSAAAPPARAPNDRKPRSASLAFA